MLDATAANGPPAAAAAPAAPAAPPSPPAPSGDLRFRPAIPTGPGVIIAAAIAAIVVWDARGEEGRVDQIKVLIGRSNQNTAARTRLLYSLVHIPRSNCGHYRGDLYLLFGAIGSV